MTAQASSDPDTGDLLILGRKPRGRFMVMDDAVTRNVYRVSGPQIFMKDAWGRWSWEGHCGKFSDGTPRPPWLDREWTQRLEQGDPTFRDSATYDIADLRQIMTRIGRLAQ